MVAVDVRQANSATARPGRPRQRRWRRACHDEPLGRPLRLLEFGVAAGGPPRDDKGDQFRASGDDRAGDGEAFEDAHQRPRAAARPRGRRLGRQDGLLRRRRRAPAWAGSRRAPSPGAGRRRSAPSPRTPTSAGHPRRSPPATRVHASASSSSRTSTQGNPPAPPRSRTPPGSGTRSAGSRPAPPRRRAGAASTASTTTTARRSAAARVSISPMSASAQAAAVRTPT